MNSGAEAIQKILDYVSAYNERNYEKIVSFLADDATALVKKSELVPEDLEIDTETMKASYVKDFQNENCHADIKQGPTINNDYTEEIGVDCVLYAVVPKRTLHVTYVLRKTDLLHVRHIIHKVEQQS